MKKIFVIILLFLLNISFSKADPNLCSKFASELSLLQTNQLLMILPPAECAEVDGNKACTYAELIHLHDQKLSQFLILNGIKKIKNDIATDAKILIKQNNEKFIEMKPELDHDVNTALALNGFIQNKGFQKVINENDFTDLDDFRERLKAADVNWGNSGSDIGKYQGAISSERKNDFWEVIYNFAFTVAKQPQAPNWEELSSYVDPASLKKLQVELTAIQLDIDKSEGQESKLLTQRKIEIQKLIDENISVSIIDYKTHAETMKNMQDPNSRDSLLANTMSEINQDHKYHAKRLEKNAKLQGMSLVGTFEAEHGCMKTPNSKPCQAIKNAKDKNSSTNKLVTHSMPKLFDEYPTEKLNAENKKYLAARKRVEEFEGEDRPGSDELVKKLNSTFSCGITKELDQSYPEIEKCLSSGDKGKILNDQIANHQIELDEIAKAMAKLKEKDEFQAAEMVKNVSVKQSILKNNGCIEHSKELYSNEDHSPVIGQCGEDVYQAGSGNISQLFSFGSGLHYEIESELSEKIVNANHQKLSDLCNTEHLRLLSPELCMQVQKNPKITFDPQEKQANMEKEIEEEKERKAYVPYDSAYGNRQIAARNNIRKHQKEASKQRHKKWQDDNPVGFDTGFGAFWSSFQQSNQRVQQDFALIDNYARLYEQTTMQIAYQKAYPFGENPTWNASGGPLFPIPFNNYSADSPLAYATFLDDPNLNTSYFLPPINTDPGVNFSGQNGINNVYFNSFIGG